jgi:hypothetical protein
MYFSNTDTDEYIKFEVKDDNCLYVRTKIYVINEDKDKKIIKHENIYTRNDYRIENDELDMESLINIINCIE